MKCSIFSVFFSVIHTSQDSFSSKMNYKVIIVRKEQLLKNCHYLYNLYNIVHFDIIENVFKILSLILYKLV